MMPCYDPPENYDPKWGYITMREDKDRLVNTLGDIDAYARTFVQDPLAGAFAREILSIIDKHWKKDGR